MQVRALRNSLIHGKTAFVLVALLLICAGCVQRRFTVRSNPPGAPVIVDGYEIGTTPVATDYIYYGTRSITLVKEGYETLNVKQPFQTPWYEYFPLDFVSENLVPGQIRDERVLTYTLMPQVMPPTNELLGRADNLRVSSKAGQVAASPKLSPRRNRPGMPQPVVAPTVIAPSGTTPLLSPPAEQLPPPGGAAGQFFYRA